MKRLFVLIFGTGQTTLKSGKLKACASCHEQYAATDFVPRHYLPKKLVRKLYPQGFPMHP